MKKLFMMSLLFALLLSACGASESSEESIPAEMLPTIVAQTIEAEYALQTANAPTATNTPEQISLPTITQLVVATIEPPTLPPPTNTPVPPPAVQTTPQVWYGFQLLILPSEFNIGDYERIEIRTSPGNNCVMTYIPPGEGMPEAGDYYKTADQNGICSWDLRIDNETMPGTAVLVLTVGDYFEKYEIPVIE